MKYAVVAVVASLAAACGGEQSSGPASKGQGAKPAAKGKASHGTAFMSPQKVHEALRDKDDAALAALYPEGMYFPVEVRRVRTVGNVTRLDPDYMLELEFADGGAKAKAEGIGRSAEIAVTCFPSHNEPGPHGGSITVLNRCILQEVHVKGIGAPLW